MFKGVLAIRRMFSLVDIITNTKFSNYPNVFKIGVVLAANMHSMQLKSFQSDSPFTIPKILSKTSGQISKELGTNGPWTPSNNVVQSI